MRRASVIKIKTSKISVSTGARTLLYAQDVLGIMEDEVKGLKQKIQYEGSSKYLPKFLEPAKVNI